MDGGFGGEIPGLSPRHGANEILKPAVQGLPEEDAHQEDDGHRRGPHDEDSLTPLSTGKAIGLPEAELEANHSR
jgi:hypothetical protein